MSDNGPHFRNPKVEEFCKEEGIQVIHTPDYAPWVNGLVKSTNNLLLNSLKRVCTLDLDTDPEDTDPTLTPYNWPDHLDEAVHCLNDHIIPTLNATPWEILFGMTFQPDTTITPTPITKPPTATDIETHFTMTDSFHYNTHLRSLIEAEHKKTAFDAKAQIMDFAIRDLVQYFDSEHLTSHASIHKLKP